MSEIAHAALEFGYTNRVLGPDIIVGVGGNWRRLSPSVKITQQPYGAVTLLGGGNDYNAHLATAVPLGDGNWFGTAFGAGCYIEACISIDGTPQVSNPRGWPSFWANDIEFQSDQWGESSRWPGQDSGFCNWHELDIMETAASDRYGVALHNWYGPRNNIQDVWQSYQPPIFTPGVDYSKPHYYGFRWCPATPTWRGQAAWFFDRRAVAAVGWDYWDPSAPPAPPPMAGTTGWSGLDQRHLYLILGTGVANPMHVYFVEVWQAPWATVMRKPQ